ncbi:hypothetical protein V1477_009237 [Vespula maculifrons]|uniref:Uncharacterized protein n=1 Tax=Vespula maculifrons TaxID=7453 RepID=A0ABD2CC43_VESMC
MSRRELHPRTIELFTLGDKVSVYPNKVIKCLDRCDVSRTRQVTAMHAHHLAEIVCLVRDIRDITCDFHSKTLQTFTRTYLGIAENINKWSRYIDKTDSMASLRTILIKEIIRIFTIVHLPYRNSHTFVNTWRYHVRCRHTDWIQKYEGVMYSGTVAVEQPFISSGCSLVLGIRSLRLEMGV